MSRITAGLGLFCLAIALTSAPVAASSWGPSARGVFIADPVADDVYIHTGNGYRFDPLAGEPALPGRLVMAAPAEDESGYYLVQGHSPLSPDFAAMLGAAGAKPLSFMSNSAYVVRATPAVAAALEANAAVRWVGAYHPAYRVSEHLLAQPGVRERVVVKVFDGASAEDARAKLEALGAVVHDVTVTEWNQLIYCDLDGGAQANAAAIVDVEWIEPAAEMMEPDNSRAQWVIQTMVTDDRRIWDEGLTGTGQVVQDHDSGVRMDHCAFVDPAVPVVGVGDFPTHRKVIAYKIPAGLPSTFGDDAVTGGHGTHTSGTAVGEDGASSINDGMAKGAKLYFTDGGNAGGGIYVPGDLNTLFQMSYTGNPGGAARISTNSWGSGAPGDYTTRSQQVDQFMWNHKDFQIFFSNGNDGPGAGDVHAPATAKNCVSGGGTQNGAGATQIYAATSRGPTEDGRLKPTMCAPATNLQSAQYSSTCSYFGLTGTSMATPALAGGTALIREYLSEGWYPSGTPTPADAFTPSAALMKSMAINGAVNNVLGFTVPDNNIGWGRMHLDNVLYFPGDAIHLLLWDETTGISTGAFDEYQWVVTDAAQPLKVSVVYTDYQGNPASFIQLVNNLNLVVTAPDGTTQYLGNVYSGGQSVTGGAADVLNMEECVRRNTPELGTWTARVSAASTPQGPQPYAIVVTGGVTSSATSVEGGASQRDPGARLLASAGPNPIARSDAGTVIRYHLPRDGQVQLGIYDVAGREVRNLVSTHQAAGQQVAAWDARDASGREVPAGVYFYRLKTAEGTLSEKVVVSR